MPKVPSQAPYKALSKLRLVAWLAVVISVAGIAAGAILLMRPPPPATVAESGVVRIAGGAAIGGPFHLVDHTGRAVSEADFAGRFMLIYFGFANCPDICPTELQSMGNAMDLLGGEAAKVVPIFITVDPERDTPQVLKDYVSSFHPRMVGLTGTPEQIAQVAKAYRVYYQKAAGATPGDYQMDHTLIIYLMDGEGRYLTHFGPDAKPEQIADEIRKYL